MSATQSPVARISPSGWSARLLQPQYLYTAALCCAIVVIAAGLWWRRVPAPEPVPTVILLVLAITAQWNATKWRQDSSISVNSILISTAIAMLGPWGALVVAGLGTTLSPTRKRISVRLFNGAMIGLAAVVGAVAYPLVGGRLIDETVPSPGSLILHGLLPLVLAVAVLFVVNAALLSGMIVLTTPSGYLLTVAEMLRDSWQPYLGYGLVGFVIAVLWQPVGLGAATVVLMAVPLVLAQWSFREQTAELDTQQRTVEALVAAVEARDPVLRGRGARVAAVSIAMGRRLGLVEHDLEALRFAAWVHDVGLASPDRVVIGPVASPPTVPGRDDDPDDDEPDVDLPRLLSHPERGVRMVEGIDFLSESAPAILHHHERWDGRGYPGGLRGEQIPLLARVVAVAATACAIADEIGAANASEPGPADAADVVEVLRGRAGVQLDPGCVAIFEEVSDALPPAPEPPEARFDHDSPYASDLMAAALDDQNGGFAVASRVPGR